MHFKQLVSFFLWLIAIYPSLLFTSVAYSSSVPELELPWTCHHAYRVSQDHNMGTHTGKGSWAWDFNMPVGTLLVAPADGMIRMVRDDSTSYGCDKKYAWDANYIILAFENGTEALFLHTRAGSAQVVPGQYVKKGEPLAEVGLSGYACGAHLHFQLQQTCDSWWCPSIPANFVGISNAQKGQTLASQNCPIRSHCVVTSTESRIIHWQDSCYERDPGQWWHSAMTTSGISYSYTKASTKPHEAIQGRWNFEAQHSGNYRLEIYLPESSTTVLSPSTIVYYEIIASDIHYSPVAVDQSSQRGWVTLGDYYFHADEPITVALSNRTQKWENQNIIFADIRISPILQDNPRELRKATVHNR